MEFRTSFEKYPTPPKAGLSVTVNAGLLEMPYSEYFWRWLRAASGEAITEFLSFNCLLQNTPTQNEVYVYARLGQQNSKQTCTVKVATKDNLSRVQCYFTFISIFNA